MTNKNFAPQQPTMNQAKKEPTMDELLLNMTPSEKEHLLSKLEDGISEESINEAKRGFKTIIITDFYNPRVKVFAYDINHNIKAGDTEIKHKKDEGRAVYSVFCRSNKQTTPQNGGAVLTYFAGRGLGAELKKESFMNKELGSRINIDYQDDQFNIKFKHYEIKVPDAMVEVIAKELGKTPTEILKTPSVMPKDPDKA